MKVIIVEPNQNGRVEEVENSLESLQNLVDGYIETTFPFEDRVALVCNEEGKMIGLDPNVIINGIEYVGTIVLTGLNRTGNDFDDLSPTQISKYLQNFTFTDT